MKSKNNENVAKTSVAGEHDSNSCSLICCVSYAMNPMNTRTDTMLIPVATSELPMNKFRILTPITATSAIVNHVPIDSSERLVKYPNALTIPNNATVPPKIDKIDDSVYWVKIGAVISPLHPENKTKQIYAASWLIYFEQNATINSMANGIMMIGKITHVPVTRCNSVGVWLVTYATNMANRVDTAKFR